MGPALFRTGTTNSTTTSVPKIMTNVAAIEMLSSSTMTTGVATKTSASTSSTSNNTNGGRSNEGNDPSPTSIKPIRTVTTGTTAEELDSTMDISLDESEFNDWNYDNVRAYDEDACSNMEQQGQDILFADQYGNLQHLEDNYNEEMDDEEEEDSRFLSVDSFAFSPSGLFGGGCGSNSGGGGGGGSVAFHEDDISQLRFGESVSVCPSSNAMIHCGIGGGKGAGRPRSSLELDAFVPIPPSVPARIRSRVVPNILHEVDEETEGVDAIEDMLVEDADKHNNERDALEHNADEDRARHSVAREVRAPQSTGNLKTTESPPSLSSPPLPPDIRRKSRGGRSFRRKVKKKDKPLEKLSFLPQPPASRMQRQRFNTDITGSTPIAENTSPQRVAAKIVPPEISLTTASATADGAGHMGTLIMADLAKAAAAYAATKKNIANIDAAVATKTSFALSVSGAPSSPVDATEGATDGKNGGRDRAVGKKRSDKKKRKKKDRGGSRRSGKDEGGRGGGDQDGDAPAPSYQSAPSFDSEHINDYELGPAVEYLSLVLPVTKLGGHDASESQAPLSPKSGATLSTVGSSDWEESSVRTDSRSVLTHQGTSAADRIRETIRCANTDATTEDATDDSLSALPTFDPVDRSMKRINEARELGTVKTVDEDDGIYRPLGPVDVDDAKFVRDEVQHEQNRDRDHIQSIRDGTTDLWEAAARAQQYIRERRYDDASQVYNALLGLHRQKYGPSNAIVAASSHNLSVVLTRAGKYSEAQSHCTEALRIRRNIAKSTSRVHDILSVVISLGELGMICYARDEFSKSLSALREGLQIACNVLGYDHATVARLLNTIGCVHYETGKLVASQATFEESLDIQRGCMSNNTGGDHAEQALLNNATTLCNLGMVSIKRRQYDASISSLEEGNMVISSVVGDDHPMAANSAAILELLSNLRDGSSGEVVTEAGGKVERLRIAEVLGLSPSKIASRVESAVSRGTVIQQAMSGEADTLFSGNSDGIPKRALPRPASFPNEYYDSTDRISLGPLWHEMTPTQRIRETVLSSLLSTSLKDAVGENSIPDIVPFSQSDRIKSERAKGSMLVDVDEEGIMDAELHLRSIYDQALGHLRHEEFDEAIDVFESARRSHKDKYGETHHLVGTALHNIGVIHLHAEHYDQALESFREAVNVRTASLGPEHPDVAASLTKTGLVLAALNDYDSAIITFNSVLRVQRATLGAHHPEVGKVLSNIGCIHYELGDLASSKMALEEAVEIDRNSCRKRGDSAMAKLTLSCTLSNAGFVYEKKKDSGESIVAYEEALQIQRNVLGPVNRSTVTTLECLAVAMAAANWQDDEDHVEIGGTAKDQMIKTYIDMLHEG